MDVNKFKRLIKEAVEEVVRDEIQTLREELAEILRPQVTKANRPSLKELVENPAELRETRSKLKEMYEAQLDDEDFVPKKSIVPVPKKVVANNPFAAFIEDAAANMTAQDVQGLRNLGSE